MIRLTTDRESYSPGDLHTLGVKLVNPGDAYAATVKIRIRFPDGSDHTVYSTYTASLQEHPSSATVS